MIADEKLALWADANEALAGEHFPGAGHRRDAGIDRFILLAEAQPDEVPRRLLLGKRR